MIPRSNGKDYRHPNIYVEGKQRTFVDDQARKWLSASPPYSTTDGIAEFHLLEGICLIRSLWTNWRVILGDDDTYSFYHDRAGLCQLILREARIIAKRDFATVCFYEKEIQKIEVFHDGEDGWQANNLRIWIWLSGGIVSLEYKKPRYFWRDGVQSMHVSLSIANAGT
jgi:hypothetical protein